MTTVDVIIDETGRIAASSDDSPDDSSGFSALIDEPVVQQDISSPASTNPVVTSSIGSRILSVGAANLSERFVNLFGSIISFRALGAAAMGQFNWVTALTSYFLLVINPGLETIAKREVARKHETAANFAAAILVIEALMAALACVVVAVIIMSGYREHSTNILLAIQAFMLLLIPFDFTWLLFAREKMVFISWFNTAIQLAQLPAIILFIRHPGDIYLYALLPVPFRLLYYVTIAIYATRHQLIDWRGIFRSRPFHQIPSFVLESIPLGASQIAILIYYNVDALLLGIWHTDRVVGLYTTAYKLMLIPTLLFVAMWSVYFPVLSRLMDREEEAKAVSLVFFRRLTWIGLLAAAVTWATGRHLIVLLYGKDYEAIGPLYEWLSLNVALVYINCGLIMPLTAWGKQRINFQITAVAAVVNVGANFYLIPKYGAAGATITTIAAESIVLGLGAWKRRLIFPIPWASHAALPLATSVSLALLMRFFCLQFPNQWIYVLVVGGACCGAALIASEAAYRRIAVTMTRSITARLFQRAAT